MSLSLSLYLSIAVLFHWYRCAICLVCILALFFSFFCLIQSKYQWKHVFWNFFRMNVQICTNELVMNNRFMKTKKKTTRSKKICYFFKGKFFRAKEKNETYTQKPQSQSFVANKRKYIEKLMAIYQ